MHSLKWNLMSWIESKRFAADKSLIIILPHPMELWPEEAKIIVDSHGIRSKLMKTHNLNIVISNSKTETRIHIVFH
jgi:hypothetical protein